MAALRVAARRLVGGGQTPAVAVDKAQRRLFPRLSQVDRARSTTSSAAAAADTNLAAAKGCEDREKLLTEIHNMTEELYDKVSHAQRFYNIPGREGKNISRLHEELATQVGPRPGDDSWRMLRLMHTLTYYGGFASFIFTTYVLTSMAIGSIVELEPDEKQWIKKKRGEARKQVKQND
ncbi:uncharacterized protein LOC119349705 isoform X2 [Triticum dicoccoides]|uniref:uncharacterized protein LOC119349705 isoform X2 n=1 Tax=Triticum dicoccoides TaxID=85692 RepID=UPI00188E62D2|nr:uncharacterized protein LOC119349705 isoform X2 [Triticum dicoccoides]